MRARAVGAVLSTVIIFVLLYSSVQVFAILEDSTTDPHTVDDDALLDGPDTWVHVRHEAARDDERVRDSRGYALRFTGADDSYLESDGQLNISTNTTWTVSQPVLAVHDNSTDQTVMALGDPNLMVQYLNNSSGTDQWSAVYMTTSDTYRANVSVANASNTTFVYVERDGDNLTIYRDDTQGETVNVTGSNQISGNLTQASNCNCTLDETRTFDSVLSSSKKKELRDDPVGPLPNTDRTARIMFDQGKGTHVPIYWDSADATASNVTWVDGFDGQNLTEGTDYEWDTDGPQLKPLSGGRVAQAPVVFAEYTFLPSGGEKHQVLTGFTSAIGLAALLPFLVLVGVIVTLFTRLQP